MIKAVIFDMDGLMLDTERLAQVAWQQAAAEEGYPFERDLFLGVIGRNLPGVQQYLQRVFGAEFPFERVYHRKQKQLEAYLETHGIPVKPGLLDLLAYLEGAGVPVAVASSSPVGVVRDHLRRAGLDLNRFQAIIGGDEIEHGKPAPDIFLAAAWELGVPPDQCLVLEDSAAGIQAARAAGMIAGLVPDLAPPPAEIESLADHIFPNLDSVRTWMSA